MTESGSPPPLAAAVGDRLRRLRLARNLSQDAVAAELQKFGLAWQRSAVAALETGARDLWLADTVLICSALRATLPDLLEGDGQVTLGRQQVVATLPNVRNRLLGAPLPSRSPQRDEVAEQLRAGQQAGREAEQKAARKLGVSPKTVATVAQELWGRGLTEERDRRMAELVSDETTPRRLQAMRGHATRQLMEELKGETDGRGFPAAHYEQVADLYRAAVDAGLPPMQRIAAWEHVSEATARRWVREARSRGLIDETTDGRTRARRSKR